MKNIKFVLVAVLLGLTCLTTADASAEQFSLSASFDGPFVLSGYCDGLVDKWQIQEDLCRSAGAGSLSSWVECGNIFCTSNACYGSLTVHAYCDSDLSPSPANPFGNYGWSFR